MTQHASVHAPLPFIQQSRICRHCHTPLSNQQEEEFCCHGCRSAHDLITQCSLQEFYEIAQDSQQKLQAGTLARADYSIFDTSEYQKLFVETKAEGQQAHFYLDNISCYACVWVCEQITRQLDSEAQLSLNLSSGEATLAFNPERVSLSEFMKKFETLGYAVHPNESFGKTSRRDISRLGVALFAVSNIMMLALPEYLDPASLQSEFRDLFRWISCGLAALSVFYAGQPFLAGAWLSLRDKKLHLDLPIGLALVVCFFYSLIHTIQRHPHVYFDSTAAVVALLLIGRWFQKAALQRIMREKSRFFAQDSRFVRLLHADDREEITRLETIAAGQTIKVLAGEIIPLKGILLSPRAEVDPSLLTGESAWLALQEGSTIEAGSVNGGSPILIRAAESGLQSFLLQLQKAAESLYQNKGTFVALSERMAQAFVLFVLTMAFGTLIWNWPHSTEQAITRFATVLLIACPCIFGFGAPLVISRALLLGLQRGILFKSQNALERLALVKTFFFDKTGTLTEDQTRVIQPQWNSAERQTQNVAEADLLALFRALPQISSHHTIRALAAFAGLGTPTPGAITQIHEDFGQGLRFIWQNHLIRIGRYAYCFATDPLQLESLEYTYVSVNGRNLLQFKLSDQLRDEAEPLIDHLRKTGKQALILTGDASERALDIGQQLGMNPDQIRYRLSPTDKLANIAQPSQAAMVGNGINDSLSLAQVEIGIAVANATESLREKADIALLAPGLDPLRRAIDLSGATRRALQRCFIFALLFNLIGMSLAIGGWATPVVGAILMPISSLTIFAIARRWS